MDVFCHEYNSKYVRLEDDYFGTMLLKPEICRGFFKVKEKIWYYLCDYLGDKGDKEERLPKCEYCIKLYLNDDTELIITSDNTSDIDVSLHFKVDEHYETKSDFVLLKRIKDYLNFDSDFKERFKTVYYTLMQVDNITEILNSDFIKPIKSANKFSRT